MTVSIGIAIYPDHGTDFDMLQRQADVAMYVAKRSGRNTFCIYTKKMDAEADECLLILNGLHKAFEREEFFLVSRS
jgi:predicted signal transduction protein with EAL and GGDEF domain